MKKKNRKGIIALLLAFSVSAMLCMSVFANGDIGGAPSGSPGGGGGTPTPAGGSSSGYVGDVFDYIDPNDFNAIDAAKQKLMNLNYGNSSADINDSDIGALVNDNATAQDITKLLKYTLSVYFSKDEDTFDAAMDTAETNINTIVENLFGTADGWFDLFVRTKKDAQISVDPEGKFIWAKGSEIAGGELYDTMDRLQVERINALFEKTAYADYKNGFESMGWTATSFVDACRAIVKKADSSSSAEFALLKACARYAMTVKVDGDPVELLYAGRDIGKKGTIVIYKPGTYTMSVFIKLVGNVYEVNNNVTNVVGVYSSNPDIATFTAANDTERTMTFVVNDGVTGYTDIVIKRDPSGSYYPSANNAEWNNTNANNNWLTRFRIIVPKEIGSVTNVNFVNGILSWDPADNAESYQIELYKDGQFVQMVDTSATSYDFTLQTVTAGTYKANIVAIGSTYGDFTEYGEVVGSPNYVVSDEVAVPTNVAWSSDGYNVTWDGVTDADRYIVYIYRGQECLNPEGDVVVATAGTTNYSLDAKDYFTATGQYTARVVAVEDDRYSAEGISDIKDFVMTSTISGIVNLQSYYKENNKDIATKPARNTEIIGDEAVITIEGVNGKWYTDENGYYSITGLKNGTYKILFECDCYLARQITVKVDSDMSLDAFLYYGDFTNVGSDMGDRKINVQDVSDFLFYYFDDANVANRTNAGFNGISALTAERRAILQNIGRTTDNPRD